MTPLAGALGVVLLRDFPAGDSPPGTEQPVAVALATPTQPGSSDQAPTPAETLPVEVSAAPSTEPTRTHRPKVSNAPASIPADSTPRPGHTALPSASATPTQAATPLPDITPTPPPVATPTATPSSVHLNLTFSGVWVRAIDGDFPGRCGYNSSGSASGFVANQQKNLSSDPGYWRLFTENLSEIDLQAYVLNDQFHSNVTWTSFKGSLNRENVSIQGSYLTFSQVPLFIGTRTTPDDYVSGTVTCS